MAQPVGSEPAPASGAALRQFKIGYLIEGTDLRPAQPLLIGLRLRLLADENLRAALRARGYDDSLMVLRSCDGPADMIQRIEAEEFDLIFASSVVFARRLQSPYDPILQSFTPREEVLQRGRRRGVVFAGPSSSLYEEGNLDALRLVIQDLVMAVAHPTSATTFIYPQLYMLDNFQKLPREFLFCDTNAEVVKHVLSGLAPIGACDLRTLEELGTGLRGEETVKLYRILFYTQELPTDPVLLHASLAGPESSLRSALVDAIQTHFNTPPFPSPRFRLKSAQRRSFDFMAADLDNFDRLTQRFLTPLPMEGARE
ncbi:PhnD/SsuA/transferrin family substrate-binding protein [Candidatus Sumerlaeota bacterium]|nr:PhnD/SsuA/transferrin family substrate-binding protein [Candidatus Sumerlaeota bacterium]